MSDVAEWKAKPQGPDYATNRQRMVDIAEAIVRDDGVSALRLDSVAEGAGVHRSSLYRYFDSKEDLITAVVVQATMRLGRRVQAELGADASPARRITEGLAIALSEMAADPVHRSLMDPSASGLIARVGGQVLIDALTPLVRPMFDAAAATGVLRAGVTAEDGLTWLHIVTTGLLRSSAVVSDRDELVRLLEVMLVPVLFEPGAPDRRRSA